MPPVEGEQDACDRDQVGGEGESEDDIDSLLKLE